MTRTSEQSKWFKKMAKMGYTLIKKGEITEMANDLKIKEVKNDNKQTLNGFK